MCASRAVFSRSILAISAMLSMALSAPALAQGYSPGFHLYQYDQLGGGIAGISDDGTTAFGNGFTIQPSGVQQFGNRAPVYDASDNGAYTVGFNTRRAADGTTQTLVPGTLRIDSFQRGSRISANGQIVVGTSDIILNNQVIGASAWRWSETAGATQLPMYRPNSLVNAALNISRDGSTIVGTGRDSFGGSRAEAWLWREGEGYTILPDVPGSAFIYSEARAVNSDGSIVVGVGNDSQGRSHALAWRNGSVEVMPAPEGYRDSVASGISDNGLMVCGNLSGSLSGLPETGAVWTQDTGWVPIFDYLRLNGINVPSSLRPPIGIQMSADGSTFTGYGRDAANTQVTFVVKVPAPSGLACLLILGAINRRARARR